ncbi:MAG: type II toxin-antitoxin system Phd/YefM family antitoxin [Sulfobacillus sp.]
MKTVNIHVAKTHLSRLLAEVADGQEIVIAKAGKPMARLVGLNAPKPPRAPGFLKGKIRIADDFDAPLPEQILAEFER